MPPQLEFESETSRTPGTVQPASTKPELLSPAGDRTCLLAAVENGADAVYFGLQRHNARIRAVNFDGPDLAEVMALLHRRGVRGYVTLNTLIFPHELADVEETVRELAAAGVDAVIVQDLGLARLIRAVTPDLEIHASTQMSITSEEGVRLAAELGCSRVILARELSLDEIGKIRGETELPRRGLRPRGPLRRLFRPVPDQRGPRRPFGQPRRVRPGLPHALRDRLRRRAVDLGKTQYLLSPQDLAAYDLIPRLIELGVASLKIEGRLKAPEYVANITRHYRQAIDAAWAGRPARVLAARRRGDAALVLARVQPRLPRRQRPQGAGPGRLRQEARDLPRPDRVRDRARASGSTGRPPSSRAMGSSSTATRSTGVPEQGGRVYEVPSGRLRRRPAGRRAPASAATPSTCAGPSRPGVWKTDDPELTAPPPQVVRRPAATAWSTSTSRSVPRWAVRSWSWRGHRPVPGRLGRERLPARAGSIRGGRRGAAPRAARPAGGHDLPAPVPRRVDRRWPDGPEERPQPASPRPGGPARRAAAPPPPRAIAAEPVLPALLAPILEDRARQLREAAGEPRPSSSRSSAAGPTRSRPRSRRGSRRSTPTIRTSRNTPTPSPPPDAAEPPIYLATPRIEKPDEANLFRYLASTAPTASSSATPGACYFCAERGIPFVADFSLNAANPLTVDLLKSRGACASPPPTTSTSTSSST